jgi:hypothetical protein
MRSHSSDEDDEEEEEPQEASIIPCVTLQAV